MNMSDLELPSNQKLGFFFSAFSFLISTYFYFNDNLLPAYILVSVAFLFLAVTLAKPDLLLPLNKLWMRLGLLLGRIVSPIVLAVLFFLMFAPIGIFMRIFGRDELRLKKLNYDSFWKLRDQSDKASSSFTQQF